MPPSARRSAPPAPPVKRSKIYALVNTFAQARGATAVLITVDGKVLESGHEVYDYAIEPNN